MSSSSSDPTQSFPELWKWFEAVSDRIIVVQWDFGVRKKDYLHCEILFDHFVDEHHKKSIIGNFSNLEVLLRNKQNQVYKQRQRDKINEFETTQYVRFHNNSKSSILFNFIRVLGYIVRENCEWRVNDLNGNTFSSVFSPSGNGGIPKASFAVSRSDSSSLTIVRPALIIVKYIMFIFFSICIHCLDKHRKLGILHRKFVILVYSLYKYHILRTNIFQNRKSFIRQYQLYVCWLEVD